ncbi:coiled-coil domain-containing protein 63 [Nyctibius grandis]|uniref:coiled-coil domain-containing protein 63 n=1 Tax=Nyctibius grandis TaxID=48427 RepID=UPI0035BC08B3
MENPPTLHCDVTVVANRPVAVAQSAGQCGAQDGVTGEGSSLKQNVSDVPVKDKKKMAGEMRRLQNKLRVAAEKRKTHVANVRRQIQTQEKERASLPQKHKVVSSTPSQVTRTRNAVLDERDRVELQRLLQTKHKCDDLLRDRKAPLAELDKQILELEKQILRQKQRTAKVKQANCSKRLKKQLETAEMRLNHATVCFDTIMTINNKLREEVEHIRMEKAVLDNLHFKLVKKVDRQRRRINTAAEQLEQAHEQRSEALARISRMKERHNEETEKYNIEMKTRGRILDQENSLKTFMFTKLASRSEWEEQAKLRKALKAQAKRGQGESQEVAYMLLLELAEDGDIDRLLNGFTEKERRNMAYATYSMELKEKVHKMERRIKDIQNKITGLEMEREQGERSSTGVLQELEEELLEKTKEADCYQDRCKETSTVLNQLKSGLDSLLKDVGCDVMQIVKQLGDDGQITNSNVMQVFDLLGKIIDKLLLQESVQRYTVADKWNLAESFASPFLPGIQLPQEKDGAQVCLLQPIEDGTADAIYGSEAPLDHDQLYQMILQRLEKEQGTTSCVDEEGEEQHQDSGAQLEELK